MICLGGKVLAPKKKREVLNMAVIVNAPLRAEMFRAKAEGIGLSFVSKAGMKMTFSAPAGEEKAKADELKKLCKADPELNTVYFQVTTA